MSRRKSMNSLASRLTASRSVSISQVFGEKEKIDLEESRTCSSFGAYFNIVCVVAGTGTLGLPYATSRGGWISLLFMVICGTIAFYGGIQIKDCLYNRSNKKQDDSVRLHSLSDIGYDAFGKPGKYCILTLNHLILLGFSCLYIILTGLNMNTVADQFRSTFDLKIWILIAGVIVLIPYVCFKNLKEVAILAIFGALATSVVIVVAVVMGFLDLKNHTNEKHTAADWRGIPMALSTISFSFGALVVYPHVEASMKTPKSWPKVLALSMLTITLVYFLISIVGYQVYGDSVKSPILSSIPSGIPNTIATIMITAHVVLAAPIFLCSFSIELEKSFNINSEHMSKTKEMFIRLVSRIVVIAILIVIAMFIPFFNDFMSLIGALVNGINVFFVPTICHVKLFGFKKRPLWEYIWLAFTLIIGVICVVFGTIDSIRALNDDFHNRGSANGAIA